MTEPLFRRLDQLSTRPEPLSLADMLPEWHLQAACRGMDSDLFFPPAGSDARDARAVCATCPVQRECLVWAVENNPHFGVWGGTTLMDRRDIRRAG